MALVSPQTWERTLLPLAYEAEHQAATSAPVPVDDTVLLERAYASCDTITSTHSRTFSLATSLLPERRCGRCERSMHSAA